MRRRAALSVAALALSACRATAPSEQQGEPVRPALTGRVVDEAGILSGDAEAELARASAQLERRRTDQFVVVTLPSLAGRTIKQTGLALGRGWGVGQRGKDNGILLIVAPTERKVRIEVGYGLESALTDREAQAIIDDVMVPRYRAGALEAGTVAGAKAVIAELNRSPLVEERR